MASATADGAVPPVRVAVVGHGMWVRMYLLPGLRRCAGVEVVAVCGRDPVRTEAAAAELSIPCAYGDVAEMVRTESPDAVLVASPPVHHREAVAAAAAMGAAVYCEKPLGLDAGQTADMVRAAAGVPTMTGFTLRWNPALAGLRAAVRAGRLGAVRHVEVRYLQPASGGALSGWHRDPAAEPHGVLSDLGPHAADLLRWYGAEAAAVGGVGQALADDGTLDECHLVMRLRPGGGEGGSRMGAGATANVAFSRVAPPGDGPAVGTIEVRGEAGWGACDFAAGEGYRLGRYDGAQVWCGTAAHDFGSVGAVGGPAVEAVGGLVPPAVMQRLHAGAARQMGDFVALVRAGRADRTNRHEGGRADLPGLRDGHEAQRWVDAAATAIARGRWVDLGRPQGAAPIPV
ncbi:Gfo/Idh/MocA family protein [Tomitella gaofuii]|uniref:Gfo/Idh/MocA family protein n=1 Tax=Tomitella gaofuii TaxID=2760083 RepID=UPI0015F9C4D5|nr:Gfo/Idh/MocA family oxidoreductase [Tomitella gaofuii]